MDSSNWQPTPADRLGTPVNLTPDQARALEREALAEVGSISTPPFALPRFAKLSCLRQRHR